MCLRKVSIFLKPSWALFSVVFTVVAKWSRDIDLGESQCLNSLFLNFFKIANMFSLDQNLLRFTAGVNVQFVCDRLAFHHSYVVMICYYPNYSLTLFIDSRNDLI